MGRQRKSTEKLKMLPDGGNEMEQPGSSRKHVKVEHIHQLLASGEDDGNQSAQENSQVSPAKSETEEEGVVAVGSAVSSDPFKLFPDVVMNEYLAKYLQDPKDKANLYWASPFAAVLLKPCMANWILNELFPIQTFRAMFSRSELLSFRLVCGDWRKSIDNYYERVYDTEPNYRHYKSVLADPVRFSPTDFRIQQRFRSSSATLFLGPKLEGIKRIHLSTAMQMNPNMNPFISKSADLTILRGETLLIEERGRSMATLLDMIGSELLSLEFRCDKRGPFRDVQLAIKNCLDRVPHLVALECTVSEVNVFPEDVPFQDGRPEGRGKRFSSLPNLKSLSLNSPTYLTYLPFTRYFDQLVTLDVSHFGTFMEWFDPGAHPPLSNLRKLSVKIENLTLLNKITLLRSPLKELGIRYAPIKPCPFQNRNYNVCPTVYLKVARSFSQTLITFKVLDDYAHRCRLPIRDMESIGLRQLVGVNLPQLKCASVTILECGFGSVDHLLKLASSLEYLEVIVETCIDCKGQKRMGNVNKLQIPGYLGNLYASNIWELLPSLAEVHGWELTRFGKDWHYTRDRYDFARPHPVE